MRVIFSLCLLAALFSSGCSNYRLGTGGELSFRTLYVAPVVNESNLPQAVAVVSSQLREAFLQDGRVILVNTPEEADATLTVYLVKYGRAMRTAQANDTGLARNFDVTLDAESSLRDNRTNKYIFEKRPSSVVRQVFTDGGQQLQGEYQNVPLLAESLAKSVRSATLDIW